MKPFTLTCPQITAMIYEINENVTAVNYDTVRDVVATVFDSIDEDAYWAKNGEPVTESEVISMVNEWIHDNGPTDPTAITMELAAAAAQSVLDAHKSVPLMGISRNGEV